MQIHKSTQIVRIKQKGGCQPLLRPEPKLVKLLHSAKNAYLYSFFVYGIHFNYNFFYSNAALLKMAEYLCFNTL